MSLGNVAWLANTIGIDDIKSINSSFDDRLKLQKAAFFLKHLGVAEFTHYQFGLYLRGPYSRTLADDYYKLEDVAPEPVSIGEGNVDLLNWYIGHDNKWLEVASSILAIKKTYNDISKKKVYSLLRLSKPWVDKSMFEKILSELEEKSVR